MQLRDKTIIILAQEPWGKMFLSKHHYAVELAARGNHVYYMNGPDQENILKPGGIRITDTEFPRLKLLEHRLFYPYIIKFQAPALHAKLMRIHLKRVIKKIGRKLDLVWSYDLSNTIPLVCFPDSVRKIFMPVDEPRQKIAYKAAAGAHQLFTVTREIVDQYASEVKVPGHFINHGVSRKFLATNGEYVLGKPVKLGISGNLLRPELDRSTIHKIIAAYPEIEFHLWGTIDPTNSNLVAVQYADASTVSFIKDLAALPQVKLHGQVAPEQLAKSLKEMDAFLVCYDINKDQSRGTNYHKLMEFLATGRVIISTNVTTYADRPDLICMIKERASNEKLPELFNEVISRLPKYNSPELMQARMDFAGSHTYDKQIDRIESLLLEKKSAVTVA